MVKIYTMAEKARVILANDEAKKKFEDAGGTVIKCPTRAAEGSKTIRR